MTMILGEEDTFFDGGVPSEGCYGLVGSITGGVHHQYKSL